MSYEKVGFIYNLKVYVKVVQTQGSNNMTK